MTGSLKPHLSVNLDDEKLALLSDLRASIQQLLDICAENEVDVPEELKDKLLHGAECKLLIQTHTEFLLEKKEEQKLVFDPSMQQFMELIHKLQLNMPHLDFRIKDGKYTVTKYFMDDPLENRKKSHHPADEETGSRHATQKIKTVASESPITKLFHCLTLCILKKGDLRKEKKEQVVMEGVNLVLEPGKMYLILGAPGCGKSTLMKMIANNLPKENARFEGHVSLSGVSPSDKNVWWHNLVAYIDQIDRLHPYLTVFETFLFAWKCRSGGTHRFPYFGDGPEVKEQVAKMDKELFTVNKVLEVLGLARVKDTFVGDQSTVRGVSGGEKKRVTVGEMLVTRTPVICCDEISTGLDAATTYDITRFMLAITRIIKGIKVVSLLQPPPETVANFDELILLSEGLIIYAGPIEEVELYFNALGYYIPERMDVADWLQALPTPDGVQYLRNSEGDDGEKEGAKKHLTSREFHEKFYASDYGKQILEKLHAPQTDGGETIQTIASEQYKNSTLASLKLVVSREMLLWRRNTYQIKAKIMQTLIMSIVVGTLFYKANTTSIPSVMFQSMFFTVVGVMVSLPKQFVDRPIFYKHQDANFFPSWCYIVGRICSNVPNAFIDAFGYGTIVYFLVGLAHNDGASIGNYFVFALILFMSSMTSAIFFSVFSTCLGTITVAQAAMSVTAVIFIIFSGFTVQPDVIPNYYIWLYYINYFSWVFRAMIVNEFDSGKYDSIVGEVNGVPITEGQSILIRFGFVDNNDNPYTYVWVWYGIIFALGSALVAGVVSLILSNKLRFASGRSLVDEQGDDFVESPDAEKVEIPYTKVDLTFKNIHYTVMSSITKEKLELLKGVDGVVESGKMTALMGSSGAGKTTLMDVIAMRKTTGEITGEIRLNGHLQEESTFRRCMGYVEQFDVQTPQLTIKETCEFSAKLRLEASDPTVNPESICKFVQQALDMLELTNIQDLQVGTDTEGGLSFEQRKRLSIAVELVANPSILFLDEPTSGLDARAAAIVMRGLKRVALSGRAVCATIHQPSVAVFNGFDRLLLLKRGGEVVFFGDVGENSGKLIEYLERYDATPKIQPGENPATWMLTAIGAGNTTGKKVFDYAGSYLQSKLRTNCLQLIDEITRKATSNNKVSFPFEYATTSETQSLAVLKRTLKVYFRSPSYNTTRIIVSAIVGLLFASVYLSQRVPTNESEMNSRINSLFIAILFLSVNSQNTVLSVFESERNMFYRHKAAKMYGSSAILTSFTLAELPFIVLGVSVFVVIFYFMLGFAMDAGKFFLFWLFTFLALGTFTFIGQMLVALFRDASTAQGFGGLLVTFTSLFSGILIRPDQIPNFWIFMYWIMPGHWVFEGIFMSQFTGDTTPIEASVGSKFYDSLGCSTDNTTPCVGTAQQWIDVQFPDFSDSNIWVNALYLISLIITTRVITFFALTMLNYSSN